MTTTAFAHDRIVTPGAPGANKLEVDVALLSRAQSDLRDLRLLDERNREVGYLLVPPATTAPRWVVGSMLPIATTKNTSGFEVDLGRATNVDRLKLEGIAAPFLKHITLEGSGDRARWTLLADATVFDLPDEELRLTEVSFTPGDYRYLRVTWNDRSSARVTNVGRASARLSGGAGGAVVVVATSAVVVGAVVVVIGTTVIAGASTTVSVRSGGGTRTGSFGGTRSAFG
jgi:hypothetical protein